MQESINTIIHQWLNGEDEKFEAVYNYYRKKIYRYSIRYVKNSTTAEEIASETLIKIWEKRNIINGDTFENYLLTIARNLVVNEWRKRIDNFTPIDAVTELASAEYRYSDHKELEQNYRETLSTLPDQRKKIFIMHRERHLTYKEIAAKLNISPKTVENQIGTTLKHMRMRLAHFFYTFL